MEFSFSDDFFDENKEETDNSIKQKERLCYVPKQRSNNWFKGYTISKDATLDECGIIKNEADLLYYQKDYISALFKYKERLKYLVNRNNNSVLRELHACIIHCCLKLNLIEEAQNHVCSLLKTTGNPVDSSIPILAYYVYRASKDIQEAGNYLYKSIGMNPWYTTYWLELFDFLHHVYSNGIAYNVYDNILPLNSDFFQLLIFHMEFVTAENQRSHENKFNIRSTTTLLKIKECRDKMHIPDDRTLLLKKLHRQMGDGKQIVFDFDISQNIIQLYSKFLFNPFGEEKRHKDKNMLI